MGAKEGFKKFVKTGAKSCIEIVLVAVSILFTIGYMIIKFVIPFWRYNNLQIWDMFGHYFSAWYVKEYLFPSAIGWNPFFFAGFPQGQFYPPLYSWLSAALSYVFGLNFAFKLVLVTALLLTPLSFYFFSRRAGLDRITAAAAMLAMWTVLFLAPEEHLGGNFHATFNVGLVTNALALPLLFFYIGAIMSSVKTKRFAASSALLALLALSHLFTAMVGVIALIATILASCLKERAKTKEFLLLGAKHTALAFLLAGFWAVPFVAKSAYARPEWIGTGFAQHAYLLFGLAAAYFAYTYFNKKEYLHIATFMLLFVSFVLVGNALHLQLHFYRFQLFFYLLAVVCLASLVKKRSYVLFAVAVLLCAVVLLRVSDIHPEGVLDLPKFYNITGVDGRLLVLASPEKQPSPHMYQHFVPLKSMSYGLKGLFVESSPNSKYVLQLEKELDSGSLVWGTRVSMKNVSLSTIEKQLDLFAVSHVFSFYSPDGSNWEYVKRITFFNGYIDGRIERFFYELYRLDEHPYFEVLDYKPRVVKQNWENEALKWFMSEDTKVFVDDDVPDAVGDGSESIEVLEMSPRQDYIKMKVDAAHDVPVLIKISKFPNWKAYVGGKKAKIYRASPHLMLVYGRGIIELKYERTVADILGLLLSFAGVAWLTWLLIYKGVYRQ